MLKPLLLLVATSGLTCLSAPTQDMVVRLRLLPGEQALLAFSTGRGPAVRFSGVRGALRLDSHHLLLVPAAAPDAFGFSVNRFVGAGTLPPELVLCQALVADASGARILPLFQPLADDLVAAAESGLPPLGSAGPLGPFLFGLTRDELMALAQNYAPGPVQEPLLLEEMRRPFHRAKNPDLAREIGLRNLLTVMHHEWSLMQQRASATTIRAQQDTLITQLSEHWFHARYPSGVPHDDDHWDLATTSGPGSACGEEVISTHDNRFRIKLSTTLVRSPFSSSYICGYASVRAYMAFEYKWIDWHPDYLAVSGSAQSNGNSASLFDRCYGCGYVSDLSAFVRCTVPGPRVDTYAYAQESSPVVTVAATGCDTTF
jgi:hypothetical protein